MKALILCGALIALAAPATAGVRPAADRPDAFETTARLADLNLGRVSGADAALARIQLAARQVCGARPSPLELAHMKRHRACVATATDAAVAALDAPLVAARHAGSDTARLASR